MAQPPDTSLWRSLAIQGRVVHALFLREVITRYGRHNIGFLWLFVEPMLFTVGVTALWSVTRSIHNSDLPIEVFALTGYSSVLLWRNITGRCVGAIGPNLALMYHRNVKVIDIFASRILLELVGTTVSFIVLSLVFLAVGWIEPPEDNLKVVLGWVMLAWFGSALGLLAGAWSERSELVEKIWHPTSYLLFPLSGAAFLVDALPPRAQELVLLLPMVHGVELLRDGYFGSVFTAHYDLTYMAVVCLCMSLLAMAEVRTVGRQVAPE